MSRAHGAAASFMGPRTSMVAVAIYSTDPALRLRLEQLVRAELGYTVAGVTHDPATVSRLIEQSRVDTVVAHAPWREQLTEWRNLHPWMEISPLSELFAPRGMRHHRVDATLLDQSAHRCRIMGDAGDCIAQFCAHQLFKPQPERGIG